MRIEYASRKVKNQCTNIRETNKLFGGNKKLVNGLLSRINSLENAKNLKDIIVSPYHFHKLHGNYEGLFAIDVKTRKDPWRVILEPLDEYGEPYIPCNIDEIADKVRIVKVEEVSNHYE